ncbi:transcription termination/antitermination protein NusG [Acidicapsa ligni]|uniref:transcription termination/antitermination protein NusG n=1 Tax=Acidicapsa ligni TaxID=542300 RepID=UPI0037C1922C
MPRWYAVTTQSRHEKVVTEHLKSRSIEAFLPVITTPSRWKDRRVLIDRPIFPGYVFTHIGLHERQNVFSIPGVVRMLSFNGKPAEIDDAEIEAVRICLTAGNKLEPHPFLKTGEHVRVKSGSLMGLEGVVTRHKNQCRIVVSITLIHQSLAVEIDAHLLESLNASPLDSSSPQPALLR